MKVTIVGATGAVGQELIKLFGDLPDVKLNLLASPNSGGKLLQGHLVKPLSERAFAGSDFVIFCTPADVSKEFVSYALQSGATVVDNSSAFRRDPEVPLIIPEVNGYLLESKPKLIANPNCSAIIALMVLYPLHKAFGLKRFFASTYQAVSGAGNAGIGELYAQGPSKVFPEAIAYNVIPQIEAINSGTSYTYEEEKMVYEARKILDLSELKVSATCVRVPVERSHSIAINAEFVDSLDVGLAQSVINEAPGVELNSMPSPLRATNKQVIQVGRIRLDSALDNGLALFVSGDQLLKGAALNVFQVVMGFVA